VALRCSLYTSTRSPPAYISTKENISATAGIINPIYAGAEFYHTILVYNSSGGSVVHPDGGEQGWETWQVFLIP